MGLFRLSTTNFTLVTPMNSTQKGSRKVRESSRKISNLLVKSSTKFEYGSRKKTRTFNALNINYLHIFLYIFFKVRKNTMLMTVLRDVKRFTPIYPHFEPRTSNLA